MGILEEQDRPIFIKHLELADNLKNHGFIKNYDKQVYNELDYLYKKYINENNPHRHWCGSCRAELITYLYRWYDLQEQIDNVEKIIEIKKRGRKPKQK